MPARPAPPLSAVFVATLGALALALTLIAALSAERSLGMPFPAFFMDPFGNFSEVALPRWDTRLLLSHQIGYPDRVLRVAGQAAPPGAAPAEFLQRALPTAPPSVSVLFSRRGVPLTLTLPCYRLGRVEQGVFFGLYTLAGWILLWSGLVVRLASERRAGAAAYGALCAACFLFLVCFLDYHSQALLAPLFSLSTALVPLAFAALACAFPEPPRWPQRAQRRIYGGALLGVGALTAVLLYGWVRDRALANLLQRGISFAAPLFLLTLPIAVTARLARARGRARAELRAAAAGLLLAPLLGAVTYVVFLPAFHLLVPLFLAVLVLALGHALCRHNILHTRAVLTRGMLRFPLLVLGLATALAVSIGLSQVPWLLAPLLGLIACAAIAWGGERALQRLLFPAASRFRPTIERLGDRLAGEAHNPGLRRAIEAVVRDFLPGAEVQVLPLTEALQGAALPADADARLRAGEALWTEEAPWLRHYLCPMRSLGELRAVLRVGGKQQGALFTSADLELITTVADLGGLALHNVAARDELTALRRLQVEATRVDKTLALASVGAELSHEIAYPLSFLRFVLRKTERGTALSPRESDACLAEIARLQRMLGELRRLKLPALHTQPLSLQPVVRSAVELVQELLAERQLRLHDLRGEHRLRADPDGLLQVLANLLRNAAQAAPIGGEIGVGARREGGGLAVEVWDSGPGIPDAVKDTLYNPWVSTREDGAGMGLSITQRIVRAHGFRIENERRAERTVFIVHVPAEHCLEDPS